MRTRLTGIAARAGTASWPLMAAVSLAVLVPGFALARSAVSSNHEVHFCYVPGGGTVYRIKEPGLKQQCSAAEHTEFVVNAQGIPGPQGPQGPQGPPGPQGDPGVVTGYERVLQAFSLDPAEIGHIDIPCPSGKRAVGGGFATAPSVALFESHPLQTGTTWHIGVRNNDVIARTGGAFAVCIDGQ